MQAKHKSYHFGKLGQYTKNALLANNPRRAKYWWNRGEKFLSRMKKLGNEKFLSHSEN